MIFVMKIHTVNFGFIVELVYEKTFFFLKIDSVCFVQAFYMIKDREFFIGYLLWKSFLNVQKLFPRQKSTLLHVNIFFINHILAVESQKEISQKKN